MSECELINLSPQEEQNLRQGALLPVMEVFYSIQGEGFNTGRPAAFLRIGGCDVGCHWCDVKEAWNANLHPLTKTNDVIEGVIYYPARAVVITGGEPLKYNLKMLCDGLKKNGMTLFLETCGAYPLSGKFDWICLSPKKNIEPREDLLQLADELKVIVHEKEDLLWAEKNATLVGAQCRLFLQPEWSRSKDMVPLIVDYVKQHPQWMVSLQAHKFINIP